MFFLLRTAFWISLLLLVLPFGGEPKGEGPSATDRASIDALSALAAAGATVSDMSGFCSRQPDACAIGGQALKVVGERARVGAAALTDYFADGKPKAPATGVAELKSGELKSGDLKSGAVARPGEARAVATPVSSAATRQTLTTTDRKPTWRRPPA